MMKHIRPYIFPLAVGLFAVLALWEVGLQMMDSHSTHAAAIEVVRQAGANTPRQKVLAIRDYLRRHIRFQDAPDHDRSFLRATAAETLRDRLGFCGEVSRTFICMADAVGINAQRVNLYGKHPHVVVEADLGPEGHVIVDCQNPPSIVDLESLDKVMQRPEYDDYSTINLRRLGLGNLVGRLKLNIGGNLTYLLERPHALKAVFWAALAFGLISLRGLRSLVRWLLHWRSWFHISDKSQNMAAVAVQENGLSAAKIKVNDDTGVSRQTPAPAPFPDDNQAYRFPVSVKGVIFHEERVILLKNGRDEWELPGGKLELNETLPECVAREVEEETGVRVQVGPILASWIYHIAPQVDVLIVIYGCVPQAGGEVRHGAEHHAVGFFEPANINGLNMPEGYKKSIQAWSAALAAADQRLTSTAT
jgi:8-oxo-dGTP pyrophosphatase MutT (NUDIX family)